MNEPDNLNSNLPVTWSDEQHDPCHYRVAELAMALQDNRVALRGYRVWLVDGVNIMEREAQAASLNDDAVNLFGMKSGYESALAEFDRTVGPLVKDNT